MRKIIKSLIFALVIFAGMILGSYMRSKAAGAPFEPDWITNAAVSAAIGFAVYFSDRTKSNK